MAVKFGYIKSKLGTILGITPFFPIGYIIEETSGINPEKWYGGTWELYGKGRVTACINSDDTDTNIKTSFNQEVGTVIGNKSMQSHNHSLQKNVPYGMPYNMASPGIKIYDSNSGKTFYGESYNPFTILSSGSGDAQNIQPTILVYRWRKTDY